MLLIIAIGVVIVLLLLRFCPKSRQYLAMWIFSLAWMALCAWNLNIGLSQGYALGEELLVHAFLYGIPVGLGWWRVCRAISEA